MRRKLRNIFRLTVFEFKLKNWYVNNRHHPIKVLNNVMKNYKDGKITIELSTLFAVKLTAALIPRKFKTNNSFQGKCYETK